MADKVSRFSPTGSMDKDSDPRYVGKGDSNGDYIDARNIQCVPQDGNENGTISPTLGNEFAFSLGSVSQQNKRYRLVFDGDVTKQHELKFSSANRDANIVVGTGTNGALSFNGTVTSFTTAFNNAISGSGVSWVLSTSTPGEVELELASYPMYQWYLESVGPNVINPIVIAEAIPVDLAGPLKDIGSYDLLGDLFIFSTTQDNEPTAISATIIAIGPTLFNGTIATGPTTTLTFSAPHGMVQGQWITISGSFNLWLNGLFLVSQVLNATQIEIPTVLAWGGTLPQVAPGPEVITIHPRGIGEIGVAQKNDNTGAWTYIRLLRSVELNFITTKQIDSFFKRVSGIVTGYFTDNYNQPRRIVYKSEYIQDGALNFVFRANEYAYGSIREAMVLQRPESSATVRLVEQSNVSGELYPGIKYYVVRQKTVGGTFSSFSGLSSPILVTHYYDDDGIVYGGEYAGGRGGSRTTVANTIEVSNLSSNNVYPISQVACVEIVDGVVAAEIVTEFETPISGLFTIIDTGINRIGPIDVAKIIPFGAGSRILKAKNIREIDLRNVISNVSTLSSIDLAEFALKMRHSLVRKVIKEGTLTDVGDFQSAETLKDSLGLMLNETYRVGCRAYLRNIGWTDYFYVDDIKIDNNAINTSNPLDNRRISGLPSMELSGIDPTVALTIPFQSFENTGRMNFINYTDVNGAAQLGYTHTHQWEAFFAGRTNPYESKYIYYSPQLEFFPDWSVPISELGNAPAGEVISAIEFGIANVPHSVKASGIGVYCAQDNQFLTDIQGNKPDQRGDKHSSSLTPNSIYEFPFSPIQNMYLKNVNSYPFDFLKFTSIGGFNNIRLDAVELNPRTDYIVLHSPDDIIEGGENFFPELANEIIILGAMESVKVLQHGIATASSQANNGAFSIFHPSGQEYFNPSQKIAVVDVAKVKDTGGASTIMNNGEIFERVDGIDKNYGITALGIAFPDTLGFATNRKDSLVFRLASPAATIPEVSITKQFRGVVYAQAYSDERANFKEKSLSEYSKIGESVVILSTPQQSIVVNGGDTSTTLFYYKNRSAVPINLGGGLFGSCSSSLVGMVTQSRKNAKMLTAAYLNLVPPANTQLKLYPTDFISSAAPISLATERVSLAEWGMADGVFLNSGVPYTTSTYELQRDYDWNAIPSLFRVAHTSFLEFINEDGMNREATRIWYSERSIIGEISDSYRIFLPISIKDLDPSFGEIFHHESVNGELFTLQPRKWQSQFFNTRGEIQVSGNALGAIIGDGSVLSRDGRTLSRYGTQNKWSASMGVSLGGKDVLYWYNAENGLFIRFGADGTSIISDATKMRAFSNRAANWLRGKDVPAFEQGIRSVWDDRSKEMIWTFTGWRLLEQWAVSPLSPSASILVGLVIKNDNAPSDSFEGFPRFFKCILTHVASIQNEPGVGSDWETYWEQVQYDDFNYYSIFTLAYNEVTNGFSTFYGHIPKTYLKWRDTFLSSHPTERNLIYEHRRGLPTTWYESGVTPPKIEDAYIEAVINDLPEESKRFISAEILSENIPDRIEYRTESQYTWSEPADFKVNDDQFRGFILNDATVSQSPRGNTRRMDGDYIKAKFFFIGGTMNKLYSMVVKLRGRLRDFRQ